MAHIFACLLTLFFSLSSPAMEANSDFCRSSLAAEGGALANANFAQRTFSQAFSSEGAFAGRTVEDVAAGLRSGQMGAADVPIQYIVRDGNTLMLNTRSAQALEQAASQEHSGTVST